MMNWLAHLHLASLVKADFAASLLPDIINVRHLDAFDIKQQYAIKLHQAIDRFTDAHPTVKASKRLFNPTYTRFAGVLTDIVYDYCLSQSWSQHSVQALASFIAKVHSELHAQLPHLPYKSQVVLHHLIQQNWLSSYQTHVGLAQTFGRISTRLRQPTDLVPALIFLQEHEEQFKQDFQSFYPQLKAMVQLYHETH